MIAEALARAVARLADAGVPDPGRDARRLLAHALGVDPSRISLMQREPMPAEAAARFEAAIAARSARQPVAQIIGTRAFYGRTFAVTEAVLDPRPETEVLVEAALAHPFRSILDLGTGSGCILLTLLAEVPGAKGTGTDLSLAALEVADRNARTLGLWERATLIRSDWFSDLSGRFDLIVSNPPYIAVEEMADLSPDVREWEPRMALTDEADGLAAYRAILSSARGYLTPGGHCAVEIGPTQAGPVEMLFDIAGFEGIRVVQDLDGRDRVVLGQSPLKALG